MAPSAIRANAATLGSPASGQCNCWKHLPWNSHPIFSLRRASIAISLIGIIFCVLVFGRYSYSLGRDMMFGIGFVLFLSTVFCVADLFFYARQKAKDPDNDPQWPKRRWMIFDVVLFIWIQSLFWNEVPWFGWVSGGWDVLSAWALLAEVLCSLLHAYAFWKQVIARHKNKWLANQPQRVCGRCGYREPTTKPHGPHPIVPSRTKLSYVGPSVNSHDQPDILTPDDTDQALEEGLLNVEGWNSGYGSIAEPDCAIDQAEEIVAGKGKRKSASGLAACKSSRGHRRS